VDYRFSRLMYVGSLRRAGFAEEDKPTGDATVAVLSKYVWRGQELSRNSVVVQPSATVGYKGFSVNVWGNLDTAPYYSGTDDISYSNNWTETDVTLSYSKTIGLIPTWAQVISITASPRPTRTRWTRRIHRRFLPLWA